MRYLIDFDGTITQNIDKILTNNTKLNIEMIKKINELHNNGHEIIIFTSRGMKSRKNNLKLINKELLPVIINLLDKNNVLYDEIIMGKPYSDLIIDDLSIHPIDFLKQKNILIGKFGRKIYFNKNKWSCKGGHYEIVGLIDFLKEQHKLFVFGEYDEIPVHKNVILYNHELHNDCIDLVLIDNGVTANMEIAKDVDKSVLNNSSNMISIVNSINAPILYSLVDPRLTIPDNTFNRNFITLHQNANTEYRGHQEKLCLLNLKKTNFEQKENLLVVIGRDNGRSKLYDEYISELRKYVNIEVYGNFKLEKNNDVLKGEISSNEVYKVYNRAKYSFMIGVESKWLTQKLIETIHYNAIPLMYYDYDMNNLETHDINFLKINNINCINKFFNTFNDTEYHKTLFLLQQKIKNFYDAKYWLKIYNKIFDKIIK
jgi:capsule biosynthesis phosphatase